MLIGQAETRCQDSKQRVIVLTDINNVGGDPDDKQSMSHLFMYADEVDIKTYGNLGYYIWEVVQSHSWAHYFRVGDTPTLLFLLEDIDHEDPCETW